MLFPEWKYVNFDYDFAEICSHYEYPNIGSDNVLAPARPRVIIWGNYG